MTQHCYRDQPSRAFWSRFAEHIWLPMDLTSAKELTSNGIENHFSDDRRTVTADAVKTIVDAAVAAKLPSQEAKLIGTAAVRRRKRRVSFRSANARKLRMKPGSWTTLVDSRLPAPSGAQHDRCAQRGQSGTGTWNRSRVRPLVLRRMGAEVVLSSQEKRILGRSDVMCFSNPTLPPCFPASRSEAVSEHLTTRPVVLNTPAFMAAEPGGMRGGGDRYPNPTGPRRRRRNRREPSFHTAGALGRVSRTAALNRCPRRHVGGRPPQAVLLVGAVEAAPEYDSGVGVREEKGMEQLFQRSQHG